MIRVFAAVARYWRGASPGALFRQWPLAVLAGVVLLLFLSADFTAGGATPVLQAAILVVFAMSAWALELFPEPSVTLLFFLLAMLFHVAKPGTIFAGFQSTAWWLIFGGSITAAAVHTTGLGLRLARLLFGRIAPTYRAAVAAVAVAAVALAFVMPSTIGRVLLLSPIVTAFADRLGLAPGRTGRDGLIVAMAAASYMPPTTILPANVPNTILLGAAESLYGVKLTYGPYLLLHFPILGALKTVLLVALVCRFFPERGSLRAAPHAAEAPMSRDEKLLAVVLAASLLLFATDFWHGVSPAWISLAAGVFCLLPGTQLVSPRIFAERVSIIPLIYIAGILGVAALVADGGLGALLSGHLLQLADLTPGHVTENLAILAAIDAALGFVTTVTSLPAVLTPLAGDFATASGLPLYTVLMLEVVAFSIVFLPYQSPPMMIALHLGGVRLGSVTRFCLALAALTIAVLLPLDYLWWHLLGMVP
jgi:di/tricarboxylate transporter